MKARPIRHLRPKGALADNAQRIVTVRLDELCSFMPAAADPDRITELHDMRIAAKRLRYVLEVTGHCFGPYAGKALRRTKELQELLGEIHDCDVHAPDVERLINELRAQDVASLRAAAGDAADLDPALVPRAPHGPAYPGLVALSTYLVARREVLFARFLELWTGLEREGFRHRLEYAITERPPAPARSDLPQIAPELVEPARTDPPGDGPPEPEPVTSAAPVIEDPS